MLLKKPQKNYITKLFFFQILVMEIYTISGCNFKASWGNCFINKTEFNWTHYLAGNIALLHALV